MKLADDISSDSIWPTAVRVREIVEQVTAEEFRWQHAHYSQDSRYGRELLFLIANSGWIRTTRETVDITHSDSVDTTIKVDINLDQITHEAFHADTPYRWLPLLVLPPNKTEEPPRPDTRVSRPPLRPRSTAQQGARPNPARTLTVSDAAGRLIATVPDIDVLHWISAALAEIIVNMAAASWQPPAGEEARASGGRRPVATRDQRLVMSAAIYRLLRTGPADPPAEAGQDARIGGGHPSGRGLRSARDQLSSLLQDYLQHYQVHRQSRLTGAATGFAGAVLVERAVQVLTAFSKYVVVVVPVHRDKAPTTLTVQVPTRPLTGKQLRTYGASRARLLIDVLAPSADADRQVEINLPDGVRFDGDPELCDMSVKVEKPQSLVHLDAVMSQLVSGDIAPVARPPLADLAVVKARAADETLRHYYRCETAAQSVAELTAKTNDIRAKLATLTTRLDRLSACRGDTAEPALASVRDLWDHGRWLPDELQRRSSSYRPSPRTMTASAPMVEDISKRAAPARARVQVDVGIGDAQFFSAALLAGTMSVLIMLLVLGFFLYSLVSLGAPHGLQIGHTPSQEVLGGALTLFTAVLAAQIEPADQSTLRGLLSALGWLIIAVSLMPTVIVAVALAFNVSGWAPVRVAIIAIAVEIALQVDFQLLLRRRRVGQIMGIPRRLELQTEPLDYSGYGVLQSEWWRSTTADALKIGRLAYAYVVWERDSPSLPQLLSGAWQSESLDPGDGTFADAGATPRPANILALLRAGTSGQSLTFVVFREQPAEKWVADWHARRVELDPDRLAPTESATDTVELFVSIPRRQEPPALGCHPLGMVLAATAACRLSVMDIQLPVPSPLTAYPGRTWARVRVGLRDGELHRLAGFLGTIHHDVTAGNGPAPRCSVLVRTAPERRLRAIFSTPPMRTTGKKHRVTASEIDVITAATHWPHQDLAGPRPWRVLALTANARTGIENDILAVFGGGREQPSRSPQLKVAGLTYAVVHGVGVALALGYQPAKTHNPDTWPHRDSGPHDAGPHDAGPHDAGPHVIVDEWQNAEQLGQPGHDPLLSIRINAQDRPGTLTDVLEATTESINETLRPLARENVIVWHALTRVAVGHDTRLTARLPVSPRAVKDWDEATFEVIERATRRYAADAAAKRKSRHLPGDELGAPEGIVIGITLIEAPADNP